MLLNQCPNCNQQVSDEMNFCPHCGYSMKTIFPSFTEYKEENPDKEPESISCNPILTVSQNKKSSNLFIMPLIMIGVGIVICIILSIIGEIKQPQKQYTLSNSGFQVSPVSNNSNAIPRPIPTPKPTNVPIEIPKNIQGNWQSNKNSYLFTDLK